ncbi:MAG: HDIG domain-containing protein [Treponema sp.]|jgi:putative nucleotidyltransferase with HDIG domain|nr:HDIG domain-containing protein [Treponema sp.]
MKKMFKLFTGDFRNSLRGIFRLNRARLGPGLCSVAAFIVTAIVVIANMNPGAGGAGDLQDFETGKVSDRDVIADRPVSYIDTEATRLRTETQEHLVPAVFRFSVSAGADVRNSWRAFCDLADKSLMEGASADAAYLAVQAKYPAYFSADALNLFLGAPDRDKFRDYGLEILDHVLEKGVFAINSAELHNYNPDVAEVLSSSASRSERERVPYGRLITKDKAGEFVMRYITGENFPDSFSVIAADMLKPFISENVFFSPGDTKQRITEIREQLEPVVKYIDKGKRVIRKGFIITDEDMRELRALNASLPGRDPRNVAGLVILLIFTYSLFIFLKRPVIIGRELENSESYLLSALACLYLSWAVLARNLFPEIENFPTSIIMPTALVIMLPAILIGPRLAFALAMALPLGAYLSGAFDSFAYFFALVSGLVASTVLNDAEKRMDLIKAGGIIAVFNCVAVLVILLMRHASPVSYPALLFWSAFNGIISGMLVLGFLPPLEHALNAATAFRLMELSDLNAPILKKLFTAAPGTYSHSIMVANLAEQACQDIGANALLARVGAYYHDLGKMENPGYFVENQTDHNKHDDINPRLSATVIRSHVKLGVEKARSLGLPHAVISIIAEHHGNSLIAWFYNKALQQEGSDVQQRNQVNMDDFAYPGVPPRSRESAVVMLADVTEAAVRTLSKPTAAKMEKFIQELFDAKVKHGQLSQSDLTFRDLETIKNAFVRVLAGYYHSRIEYPKIKEDGAEDEASGEESAEKKTAGEGADRENTAERGTLPPQKGAAKAIVPAAKRSPA